MVDGLSAKYAKSLAISLGLALALGCAAPTAWARLLPSAKARTTPPEPQRVAGLPSDAELESSGARIGYVHLNERPLFDVENHDENTALSRTANRLHIATREATILDQLLFRSGDPYRASLLRESARMLRDTRYLRDALIRPVAYRDGVVDVEVTTQDVWTLNPGISFGRKGGKNTGGIEFEELNFLGLGTQLGLGLTHGVDRDSKTIAYHDRQLGSSWWDLATRYSDNSDGRLAEFGLAHPFYALDTRWAAGVGLADDRRTDSRYDLGEVIDQYQTRQKLASVYWGWSDGLRGDWVRRYSVGLSYDDHQFGAAPDEAAPRLLPDDRRLVYPWFSAEWVQDDFRTDRNRDQIEKTEDYSLGWRARAQLGYASTAIGSDRDAFMFVGGVTKGAALSERQTLQFDLDAAGRYEDGELHAGKLGAGTRYYFRQSPRRLLFMDLSAEVGHNLDVDQQILLGGDTGLRGYPLRYQAGEGRWLFTAEQRFFTNWYPFQLFNVGAAVFYDMGATWGRDPLGAASQGLLRDVGFGLRFGNSRSALGNVLHVDVAFPLDGDSSINSVQFLVETRKSF
jgi:outer membrane protein assembly factor BamA